MLLILVPIDTGTWVISVPKFDFRIYWDFSLYIVEQSFINGMLSCTRFAGDNSGGFSVFWEVTRASCFSFSLTTEKLNIPKCILTKNLTEVFSRFLTSVGGTATHRENMRIYSSPSGLIWWLIVSSANISTLHSPACDYLVFILELARLPVWAIIGWS